MSSEQCPSCGGQLAVNQDGWKICHSCGYASPPGFAPAPAPSSCLVPTTPPT